MALRGQLGEYLDIHAVCERIGRSVTFVRSAEAEGLFPRHKRFGARAGLWSAVDVEVWLRAQRVALTRQPSLMRPAGEPMRVELDVVTRVPRGKWSDPGPLVHVRVFCPAGGGPGDRIVVVAEMRHDSTAVMNMVEQVMGWVDEQYLAGTGGEALWVTTCDEPFSSNIPDARYEAMAVLATRDADGYHNPSWQVVTPAQLDDWTGHKVAWFPHEAYTEVTVTAWQRSGEVVDVPFDRLHIMDRVRALRFVDGVDADSPHAAVTRWAGRLLAEDIKDLVKTQRHSWDDGTTPGHGYEGPWPSLFAARLAPIHLSNRDKALVDEHATSTGPLTISSNSYLADLSAWIEQVDPDAEIPDADAARHLELVFEVALRDSDGRRPVPDERPDVFEPAAGRWNQVYLNSLHEVSLDPTSRAQRQLKRAIKRWIDEDAPITYHQDPSGRAAATAGTALAIMWPTTSPWFPQATLHADGNAGSRPVYLVIDGEIVGLLPQHDDELRQWNFGYGGSGPYVLTEAITAYVANGLGVPTDRLPWEWIFDAVAHADKNELDIRIPDIIRRITH